MKPRLADSPVGDRPDGARRPQLAPQQSDADVEHGDHLHPVSTIAPRPWVPSRPVLQAEENVIEVGWDTDPETAPVSEPVAKFEEDTDSVAAPQDSERSLHVIDDPYAALQAALEAEGGASQQAGAEAEVPWYDEDSANSPYSDRLPVTNIWPDAPHPFEPYGDLFAANGPATRVDP
jgi:hypothetical protein